MSDLRTLELKRNNDRTYKVTTKKAGVVKDVTGWSLYFSIKKNKTDSDANAMLYIPAIAPESPPTNGIFMIPIEAADTKEKDTGYYFYDVLVFDEQGKRQSSKTGQFHLKDEVTDGDE